MHQSPLKLSGSPRRDKYASDLLDDGQEERRRQRGSPPKARKFPLRQDGRREERERQHPRG